MADVTPEGWDSEVTLAVTVHVTAMPNPDYFEDWQGRTAEGCAESFLLSVARRELERFDGYADLIGEARVVEVSVDG